MLGPLEDAWPRQAPGSKRRIAQEKLVGIGAIQDIGNPGAALKHPFPKGPRQDGDGPGLQHLRHGIIEILTVLWPVGCRQGQDLDAFTGLDLIALNQKNGTFFAGNQDALRFRCRLGGQIALRQEDTSLRQVFEEMAVPTLREEQHMQHCTGQQSLRRKLRMPTKLPERALEETFDIIAWVDMRVRVCDDEAVIVREAVLRPR